MHTPLKIYVLGSTHFMHHMVACKNALIELGYDGWIHEDYEAFVRGEKREIIERWRNGEHAQLKRENGYLKVHYQHILASDAILFVNDEKKGIQNYVGGNVLIEMGQAYVNDRVIFLLNDLPTEPSYVEEIKAMDPICLHGDLSNIKKWEKEQGSL